MKTLEDFIFEYMKEQNLWITNTIDTPGWKIISERYATYCCERQKEICAEHAMYNVESPYNTRQSKADLIPIGSNPANSTALAFTINKKSILTAPLATDLATAATDKKEGI